MNNTTLLKRLSAADLCLKNGTLSLRNREDLYSLYSYRLLNKRFVIPVDGIDITYAALFHLVRWERNGSHYKLDNVKYTRMLDTLKALGIRCKTGNDSPRGGKEGEYIAIRRSELAKLPAYDEITKLLS